MSGPVYIRGVELRIEYVGPGLYHSYVDDVLAGTGYSEPDAWRTAVYAIGMTPWEASGESDELLRRLSGFATEGFMDELMGGGSLLGDRARRTGQ